MILPLRLSSLLRAGHAEIAFAPTRPGIYDILVTGTEAGDPVRFCRCEPRTSARFPGVLPAHRMIRYPESVDRRGQLPVHRQLCPQRR